ncbi:hypothetical protein [Teredinibacter turnerae]|uniref:hypothetical protein n=1 Tax=Teredinibacter turnerae TaxID=2426 RepID=UPI00048C48E6|nr:hypothetical protein [Teredinibacter turnerae]
MKKIIFILIAISINTYAEEKLILGYFNDRSYWVNIPEGFYQDAATAKRIGAVFLLIPNGYDFNGAPAVIYSAVYSNKLVSEASKHDVEKFGGSSSEVKVRESSVDTLIGKNKILINEFINPSSKQQPYESVAYVQEGESVVTLVVSAFVKQNYDYILPEFIEMVKTYESVGIKVKHNKSMQPTAKASAD